MRSLFVLAVLALQGCAGAQSGDADLPVAAPRLDAVVAAGFVVPPRPEAPPMVTVTVSESAYSVEGATSSEIQASIDALSPFRNADGSKLSDAFTRWSIRWAPDVRREGSACRVERPNVTVALETTTYVWQTPPDAPPSLVEDWERRAAILLAHERAHQAIDVFGALDVADALLAVRAPCGEIRSAANAAGQRVLERIREVNAAFDRVTESGTAPPPGLR